MFLAVSGSRVALRSPVRVSQGIKDSSATLKYYKRNITHLGLKKGGESRKGWTEKKEDRETETHRDRDSERLGD